MQGSEDGNFAVHVSGDDAAETPSLFDDGGEFGVGVLLA
jgi:hypothetical protein